MFQTIDSYCRQCTVCQTSKPPAPQKVALNSIPIGRPRQMVAVDILQVFVSCHNNHYLLGLQDYFTKWPEVIPMPNQTAARITDELVQMNLLSMVFPTPCIQTKAVNSKLNSEASHGSLWSHQITHISLPPPR